jgi:hypothetical protein
MNIPAFSAQASLYKTSNRYRSSGGEFSGLPSAQPVVGAYYPGPATVANCRSCYQVCRDNGFDCESALIELFGWWDPFGPWFSALRAECDATEERCRNNCADVCCPQLCGPDAGCCDADEGCVDRNDPNSRDGCCPSNQAVCGGKCCPVGSSCVGNVCTTGFSNTPPPPPPPNNCIFGGAPCGPKCCPPGLQCCAYSAEFRTRLQNIVFALMKSVKSFC